MSTSATILETAKPDAVRLSGPDAVAWEEREQHLLEDIFRPDPHLTPSGSATEYLVVLAGEATPAVRAKGTPGLTAGGAKPHPPEPKL